MGGVILVAISKVILVVNVPSVKEVVWSIDLTLPISTNCSCWLLTWNPAIGSSSVA